MPTSSLSQAYSSNPFGQTPLTAELEIAHAENRRLQEINRQLESKLVVRDLALRQLLAWVESENQHRKKLGDTLTNIRIMLYGDK